MRFYPTSDVNFFVEVNPWNRYCRLPTKKSWAIKPLSGPSTINYWRDLEGAKKKEILAKDLYFKKWDTVRRRECARLPVFYSVGHRFIKITKAFPAGFLCAPAPMNIMEARAMKRVIRAERKAEKALKKAQKKAKRQRLKELKEKKRSKK